MKSISVVFLVWIVYALLIFGFTSSYERESEVFSNTYGSEQVVEFKSESGVTYSYDRIDEVKKECAFVLNSASEFEPKNGRNFNIKEELFFVNGDWEQDAGESPILPFDDREVIKNLSDLRSPLNLVSFWVTDIDRSYQSKKSVAVNGFLSMGITIDGSFESKPYEGSRQFEIWHSHTQLSISFQGIYTETDGERVMCLLGSTMLPARQPGSPNPWQWVNDTGYNYNQPPLLQDDQILLVLHYPLTVSLKNRGIRGELRSLNSKSNLKYFDEVHISSQLVRSKYEFDSANTVSRACDPYPYEDSLMYGGIDFYKGYKFCNILEQIISRSAFTIVPNWRCKGTDDFCSKLGPFVSDKEIRATDGGFKDVKIYMQNVKCEQTTTRITSARVSAVFRAVHPSENPYSAAQRSGISNMTVAAEGIWKSSSGQLCMVGCLGLVDDEWSTCNHRVCLYIPLTFSLKQRSILLGSLSSLNNRNASYFPLSFEKLVQPKELWNFFQISHPHYSYSKINSAGAILEKYESFSFRNVIKKSLLQFPKLEDSDSFLTSLSLLSKDLTFHIPAIPDPLSNAQFERRNMGMEILSLGPLFGRYWSSQNFSYIKGETPYHAKAEYTEKQLLLNVSAQLKLSGKVYSNFSMLFLEGLYDPHVGKMYLVGCRDVRASWNILFESSDLEAGLDCLINVVVSYPPTTARWLINPTARISITSQRNEDDPLHFSTIKLESLAILYRKQREDILSRQGVEGILRILTLSVAIACILSQLFYIKNTVDYVPYISLVMLGVQALGYSLPLVTGAETLFKKMDSESYERSSFDLEKNQWLNVVDYTVKLLVLVAFLLTLRLCQKVWKSRIRLLTRSPLEPYRVPREKWVLLITATIHFIGYITVIITHTRKSSQSGILQMYQYGNISGSPTKLQKWKTELEEYVGLVQDLFLLPQAIGNLMWQIDCKPLRKLYFIGITVVRLLPHLYDYIRVPLISNTYFSEQYEFVNPSLDFYSKFGDIAIPATSVFLAILIYIQQRWNYEKLSQTLIFGRFRLLPVASKFYQRLPSQSFEAELVSGVNNNSTRDKTCDDDE